MSFAEYTQTAEDHRCLLIVVRPLVTGGGRWTEFHRLYNRITAVTEVYIPDCHRTVHVRYRRIVPLESNAWGDFQVHRKVLGVLGVSRYTDESTYTETHALLDRFKQRYEHTLYDWRMFLFGKDDESKLKTDSGVKIFPNIDVGYDLEEVLKEFIVSLFWVLESKRLDRSIDRMGERGQLLMAPIEKKDMVGIDTETRVFKKRCQGRVRKHIGDLCLLAGLPIEAIAHYHVAIDMLKSANDWLWLAGSFEGLSAASVIIRFPDQSLVHKLNKLPSINERLSAYNLESPKTYQRTVSLPASSHTATDGKIKNCLTPSEIIDKYHDALLQYGKYKNAGVIEMECTIKAARVLILQKNRVDASEFLNNVAYINIQLSEQERVQRFCALSSLYTELGFIRKASFFKRIAAMTCVSPSQAQPNWSACYNLLYDSLSGYKLSVDPKDYTKGVLSGWPAIQVRVLHELVYAARKMGSAAVAVRHMSLLIETMFEKLSISEQSEMTASLINYTSKCPNQPGAIAMDTGVILPPVALYSIPTVRSFKPLCLEPSLHPHCHVVTEAPDKTAGLFIYSPHQNYAEQQKLNADNTVVWVQGALCEVAVELYNPMPSELNISKMVLLIEGVEFNAIESTFTLPCSSVSVPVKLRGTPTTTGLINIIGYRCDVFGISSVCKLKDLQVGVVIEPVQQLLVVAPLPVLSATTQLPAVVEPRIGRISHVTTSAAVCVYSGQRRTCSVVFDNVGEQPVGYIDITLKPIKYTGPEKFHNLFTWDMGPLTSVLPLATGQSVTFDIHITACMESITSVLNRSGVPIREPSKGRYQNQHVPHTTNSKNITGVFEMIYTCGPSGPETYHRTLNIVVSVDIKPAVVLTKWNALPDQSMNTCNVSMEIFNESFNEVILQSPRIPDIVLKNSELTSLVVELPRMMPLATDHTPSERQDIFERHLAKNLQISWTMPSTSDEGSVPIHRVNHDTSLMHMISAPAIGWEVCLNGEIYEYGTICEVEIGQPVMVDITVINSGATDVNNVVMTTQPYQDSEDGRIDTEMAEFLMFLGASKQPLGTICSKCSASHRQAIIFFSAGVFKLSLKITSVTEEVLSTECTHESLQLTQTTEDRIPPMECTYIPAITMRAIQTVNKH